MSVSSARFRRRDHAAINALWVGVHFQDAALLSIIVPALLLTLAPHDYTRMLGVLSTLAGIGTALAPPLAGAFSDRSRRSGGDRRIQTAVVLAIDTVALGAMAYVTNVTSLAIALLVAMVALSIGSTIYQVLVPEIVPRNAWGTAAGYRGAMTLIGTIIGLIVAALVSAQVAVLAAAAGVAIGALTLVFVPPSPPYTPETSAHTGAKVRSRRDLFVTLIARAWIVLGMTLLNTYVLYFFHDVLHVTKASFATGMVASAAIVGAILSSIVAGVLSDKVDRRLVVCLSGMPMALAALGFALWPDLRGVFFYSALFGFGYGGVFAVGWALALDAIPEIGDVARDLGIWGTLSNLPLIAAPGIGVWIISRGASPAEGYRWLFMTAAACFLFGSLTVLAVSRATARR